MPRHRGVYKPEQFEPYELSRFRIENFVRCPACFYMQQVEGIKFPDFPGYNINEATDVLLKRHFDKFRSLQMTPPLLERLGYSEFIPYNHPDFEKWTQSLHFGAEGRMNTVVESVNLKVGGGLDDVWQNTETNELHIVDYKSTSQKSAGRQISLDDPFKAPYKRQMDLYIWVMRRMGFPVSDKGIFLYVDGDRFTNTDFVQDGIGLMEFKVTILPYHSDDSWIYPTLEAIKSLLECERRPVHAEGCQHGAFIKAAWKK